MIDTYDVGAAKRLDRRDWRALKLMPLVLAGAVVQSFGFSFHVQMNMNGLWFFVWFGLVPLVVYAIGRWIETKWRNVFARLITSIAVFVETVGAITGALVLLFFGVVALMGLVS